MTQEKQAILDRVDCSSPRGRKSNPATVIVVYPLLLICEREYVRSFKPSPILTRKVFYFCDHTSPISVPNLVCKRLNPRPRLDRDRTGVDNLVVDLNHIFVSTNSDEQLFAKLYVPQCCQQRRYNGPEEAVPCFPELVHHFRPGEKYRSNLK